jgi:probable HAF family extracellular repeat protein
MVKEALVARGVRLGPLWEVVQEPECPADTFRRATEASGINDSGQIVGVYRDAVGSHGFLFENGSYTTLDVPGSTYTEAHGINASGQIVGNYSDGHTTHGFLLDNGTYTTLDVPGSTAKHC